MMIDLEKLTAETQAECDDASGDHHYVGSRWDGIPIEGGFTVGAELTDDHEAMMRRVASLKFAAVAGVRIRRANGVRGRGMARYQITKNGLEVEVAFLDASEIFDWFRKAAA